MRFYTNILVLLLLSIFAVLIEDTVDASQGALLRQGVSVEVRQGGVLSSEGRQPEKSPAMAETHGRKAERPEPGHPALGEILPLWSCIPFAGILLSIALFPLAAPEFWHNHFGKVSAFWAMLLGIPFLVAYRGIALYEMLHIILADYVPFIVLLWALYTVSGGILLRGSLRGTPRVNVTMLIIGTLIPIEFLPEPVATIAAWTPFPYLSYAPARMFVAFSWAEAGSLIVRQSIWLLVAVVLAKAVFALGSRRIAMNGG